MAAAVPIARAARRRRQPAWTAVAVAAAVEGLGSVAYHGPGGRAPSGCTTPGWSRWPPRVGVAVGGRAARAPAGPSPPTLTAAAVALHALSRTGGPLCSCRSPLQGHAVFHVLAGGRAAAAAAERRVIGRYRPKTSSTSSSPSSPTEAGPPLGSSMS